MEKDINVEKIERLNLVLNAIREVGRLLVKENDRERLIKGVCDILVDRRGYFNAWIGLFDKEGFFPMSMFPLIWTSAQTTHLKG